MQQQLEISAVIGFKGTTYSHPAETNNSFWQALFLRALFYTLTMSIYFSLSVPQLL